MNNIILSISDLNKKIDSQHILKNINCDIKQGDFISILGPSGSGKTTLLRIIAGLDFADTGSIKLNNTRIEHIEAYQRPINLIFQNYALFPHMTIFENIAFGLKIKNKYTQKQIIQKVSESLKLVKLEGYESKKTNQISGGQQQRVAIARAIVNEPQILLLDEPLSALDQQIREEMKEELLNLQKQLGMTFIMVTHDQQDAMSLSNKIAIINNGSIAQYDEPFNIYNKPQSFFVAKFIGTTNQIHGKVVEKNDKLSKIEISDNLFLNAIDCDFSIDSDLEISVRYEHIKIIDNPESSGINTIKGQVVHVMYQGSQITYLIKIEDNIILKVINNNNSIFSINSQVVLYIPPNCINVFKK